MASRHEIVTALEEEVTRKDEEIAKIHACLKECEDMLIKAIFQANQKLKSIAQANSRKISSEDLIKFAHRISAANSVAAPSTWQQGDPERPYPNEAELRCGWLSTDANVRHMLQQRLMHAISMNINTAAAAAAAGVVDGTGGMVAGPSSMPGGSGPQQPQQFHPMKNPAMQPGVLGAGYMDPMMAGPSPGSIGMQQDPYGTSPHRAVFMSPRPGSIPTTPTQMTHGPPSWPPPYPAAAAAAAAGTGVPGMGPRPNPMAMAVQDLNNYQPGHLSSQPPLATRPFLPQMTQQQLQVQAPPSVGTDNSVGEMSSDSSDSSSSDSPD